MGFRSLYSKPFIWNIIFILVLLILFSHYLTMNQYDPEDASNENHKIEERFKDIKSALTELKLGANGPQSSGQPTVWVHIPNIDAKHMDRVKDVFKRLGYRQGSQFSDWDVLWTMNSPYHELGHALKNLSAHQKINHIPHMAHVVNKKMLSTSYDIENIPKSFILPDDMKKFEAYTKEHPDYKWIKKGNQHRGMQIVPAEQAKLLDGRKAFLQRFIENPLLVDGRVFDFGVYTVVTSIDPLRVYVNDFNWVVRFCHDKYLPFDPKILTKYVIADDFIPLWEMPVMKKLYIETGGNRKESLLSYLRSQGVDDKKIVNDAHNIIKEVFENANNKILKDIHEKFGNKTNMRNFFEVVRFDFLVDEHINVFLLESNANPNFSTEINSVYSNGLEYEQVLYSMLTMVGIGRNTKVDFLRSSVESKHMMASERNINVYSDICTSSRCDNNCKDEYCSLCQGCYSEDFGLDLKYTVMEHNHRGDWRRIIPRVFKDANEAKNWDPLQDPYYSSKSEKNKLMSFWIKGKCIKDERWCI